MVGINALVDSGSNLIITPVSHLAIPTSQAASPHVGLLHRILIKGNSESALKTLC